MYERRVFFICICKKVFKVRTAISEPTRLSDMLFLECEFLVSLSGLWFDVRNGIFFKVYFNKNIISSSYLIHAFFL